MAQPRALRMAMPVIHQSITERELTLWLARKFAHEAGVKALKKGFHLREKMLYHNLERLQLRAVGP